MDDPFVPADDLTCFIHDIAPLDIPGVKKSGIISPGNKILAFDTICRFQTQIPGNLPGLALQIGSQGKADMGQLNRRKGVEEIGLVFGCIDGRLQHTPATMIFDAGVVTGGKLLKIDADFSCLFSTVT